MERTARRQAHAMRALLLLWFVGHLSFSAVWTSETNGGAPSRAALSARLWQPPRSLISRALLAGDVAPDALLAVHG